METKESYTHKEVEEMVTALDKYTRSCKKYYMFSGDFLDNFFFGKQINQAKSEVDKAVDNCKDKIPKDLLAKIILRSSDELEIY